MSYPEKGATYKHKPKFVDRMKKAENEKPEPFKQGEEVVPGHEEPDGDE